MAGCTSRDNLVPNLSNFVPSNAKQMYFTISTELHVKTSSGARFQTKCPISPKNLAPFITQDKVPKAGSTSILADVDTTDPNWTLKPHQRSCNPQSLAIIERLVCHQKKKTAQPKHLDNLWGRLPGKILVKQLILFPSCVYFDHQNILQCACYFNNRLVKKGCKKSIKHCRGNLGKRVERQLFINQKLSWRSSLAIWSSGERTKRRSSLMEQSDPCYCTCLWVFSKICGSK